MRPRLNLKHTNRLLRPSLGNQPVSTAFITVIVMICGFAPLLISPTTFAQTELTGGVRGVITSLNRNEVIPDARVVLINDALRVRRETKTDSEGRFAFLGLPPGAGYRVTASVDHFREITHDLATLSSGDSLVQDFALEVAGVNESIDITADAAAIVSNAPEISQVIDARRLAELPSNGRGLNRFALLDPHVRNTAGLGSDGSGATRLTINASSYRHTHYRLDGNSNYESVFANSPQQQVSVSAVQEFKVLTNQYSAEYGGSSAGIISTTTRSGTDQFHGEGFVFLRPSGIQARPPIASLRVPSELWQFGGSAGGPLVKDRVSFFFNYERSQGNRGSFIQSPVAETFIGKQRDHLALARADYRFSETHSLGLRLNGAYSSNNNVNDAVSGFNQPSTARASIVQSVAGLLTDRQSWGTKLNEFRLSYSNAIPSSSRPLEPSVMITRPNYSTTGGSSFSFVRTQSTQLADQLTWQAGRHELRLGADYLRQKVVDDSFSLYGTYTFAPGAPKAGEVPVQYLQTFGRELLHYGQTAISGFAQDNWRVHPRLTLNLGLRYEYQSVTDEQNNFAPRLGFAWDVRGNGNTVIRGGGGVYYDQYYFYILRRFLFQGLTSRTVSVTLKPTDAGFPVFPNSLAAPPGGPSEARRDLYLAPERRLNPYSTQFSLGLQRKLIGGLTLTVDGISSHTLRQMRAIDINAPAPFPRTAPGQTRSGAAADATRPLKTYAGVPVRNVVVVENTGMSDYDALDVGLVKAFARRFQLEGHYVYSNATTDSMFFGEPNTGVPNDWNNNLRLEHGPSDFYQRHRFVGHGIVELPFQTQASFVLTLASGLPVDPRTGVDNNGDSNLVDRPVGFARNSFRTPAQASFDTSLARRITLRENLRLELRAEAFNLFNRSNLIKVNGTYGNGATSLLSFLTPIAGISNSDPGRQFQFALRLLF
ncbi:MAG TPA: TonB-dependent receptor [Blastocatellia bacterium]|nr:TonB-dependent receptor [Blastocatellia bacterium]